MAVGSRQILFSDSAAPALSAQSPRQVSNLSDNPDVSVGAVAARTEPAALPSTGVSAPAAGSSAPAVSSSAPAPASPGAGPAPSSDAAAATTYAPASGSPEGAVQTELRAQGEAGARVDVLA